MLRRPPRSTRTDTRFPYTTLVRSWGQGPVLLQSLALLKGFDLAGLDSAGPDFIHLVIEAMKLAYADREIYYGAPKICSVPLEHLPSSGSNDARRALLRSEARLAGKEWVSTCTSRRSPVH